MFITALDGNIGKWETRPRTVQEEIDWKVLLLSLTYHAERWLSLTGQPTSKLYGACHRLSSRRHQTSKRLSSTLPQTATDHNSHTIFRNESLTAPKPQAEVQTYLCKKLRISCLAIPSSSHAFANFTFNFSALLLIPCPFSLRHRSIVCRTSKPTASRVPVGVSPFLCRGLRPSPLLTWKSSKPAWRFSAICTAVNDWSPISGQTILQMVNAKMSCKSPEILTRGYR